MAIRRIKNHGKWIWQARVAYRGLRKAAFRASKNEARQAEADLLKELKARAEKAEHAGLAPATLRQLFEFYAGDMQARGKGEESVARVEFTAHAVESLLPELLDRPVTEIGDAEIFAFRNARAREGKVVFEVVDGKKRQRRIPNKPSTINRDLRTLRAALKKARPEYRFPGGAFFKEDETRVRWLRPEEELLVLEPIACTNLRNMNVRCGHSPRATDEGVCRSRSHDRDRIGEAVSLVDGAGRASRHCLSVRTPSPARIRMVELDGRGRYNRLSAQGLMAVRALLPAPSSAPRRLCLPPVSSSSGAREHTQTLLPTSSGSEDSTSSPASWTTSHRDRAPENS
jgi:hypothetical protein